MTDNYCFAGEADFISDKDVKALLDKELTPDTLLLACQSIRRKENGLILKLPSIIDLRYLTDAQDIPDIKAAAESICRRDTIILTDCLDKLPDAPVMLKVSGAFTALLSVTGSDYLLRQLRKSEQDIRSALTQINDHTAAFVEKAVRHGAGILSYADPSAVPEVMGEKLVFKYSVEPAFQLMQRVAPFLAGAVMHICPRISFALEKYGLCAFNKIICSDDDLIGNLLRIRADNAVNFTGHLCINSNKCPDHMLYGR